MACVTCAGLATADPPPPDASATPAPSSTTPAPIVLYLDETGLHPAGSAPLGPRLDKTSPSRGVIAARLGLPPKPRAEARPRALEWEPGEVVPFGYVPTSSVDLALRNTGIIVFTSSAGISALVGVGLLLGGDPSQSDAWTLLVPVIGPLISIETLHAEPAAGYGLVLDALTQAFGVTAFVLAWATPVERLKRIDEPPRPRVGVEVGPAGATMKATF